MKAKGKRGSEEEEEEEMEKSRCCCWAVLRRTSSASRDSANAITRTSKIYDAAFMFWEKPTLHNASNHEMYPPNEARLSSDMPGPPSVDKKTKCQLLQFSFQELKSATGNFRPDSIVGEGGFCYVFKGWIDENGTAPAKPGSGITVAVKSLKPDGFQGHREWMVAKVEFLGQLHHPNLVKLIGCCIEDDQRFACLGVYDQGKPCKSSFQKIKIALGAAKGLAFLHGNRKPVIYRDFKTSNILLDSEYNAKLLDFGLAEAGPQGEKTHVSTIVVWAHGYNAPEYVMTGHLTSKSDVYSFGVVLLEILTGRRSMDETRHSGKQNLVVTWVRPHLLDKRKLYQLVDPRLELNYSIKGVQKLSQLAYHCLGRVAKCRPTMDEVVEVLTPLQDLNDVAILSCHSRLDQQGAEKKPDPIQQRSYAQTKGIRDSPLDTGKQNSK